MVSFTYVHDIDPYIFQFGDHFSLRWYGLAYLLGFFLAYLILLWQKRAGRLDLSDSQITDLVLITAIFGIIGARLGSVFFWHLDFLIKDFLYLFRIWQGGMSFQGGLLGAAVGILWFAWKNNISFWQLSDAGTLAVTPGLMFGRISCFINGMLWGRPTGAGWGVIFPAADELPRHPSQLYQAAVEGPVLFGILYYFWRRKPYEGILSAVFLLGYGGLRFLVTFYRAPDPYTGYLFANITRGQFISLLLFAAGFTILAQRLAVNAEMTAKEAI